MVHLRRMLRAMPSIAMVAMAIPSIPVPQGPRGQGGNVAVVGGPSTNQLCGANYIMNNTTHALWKSPATVAPDPYAGVPAPTQPAGKVAGGRNSRSHGSAGLHAGVRPDLWLHFRHLGRERNGQLPQYGCAAALPDVQSVLIPITVEISTATAWNLPPVITPTVSTPPVSQGTPTMWSFSCPEFTT